MRKLFLILVLLIFVSGCNHVFVDKRGGVYNFSFDKEKELKDPIIIDKCSVPLGFSCVGYSANTSGVFVRLKNSGGKDFENFSVFFDCGRSDSVTMPNGDIKDFFVSCALEEDSQFSSVMVFDYVDSFSGLAHSVKGELLARVR